MAEAVISRPQAMRASPAWSRASRHGRTLAFGIRDIQSLAREMKLNLVENFKTLELCERYRIGRAVTSPIFAFYSVCTVGA